jgi:hypothetical protein
LAYNVWLHFLPPEQLSQAGHLFNAGFETVPSGASFDWEFKEGQGVTIRLAALPDGEHTLYIGFGPGRVDFGGVKQLVVLGPGQYKFKGKYKADIVSERGLKWSITCAGRLTTTMGESTPLNEAGPGWKDFEFSFVVPNSECPAQYVRLALDARSASEQFISGSVMYDDFLIVRASIVGP